MLYRPLVPVFGALLALALIAPAPSNAEEDPSRDLVEELNQALETRDKLIFELLQRVGELERRLDEAPGGQAGVLVPLAEESTGTASGAEAIEQAAADPATIAPSSEEAAQQASDGEVAKQAEGTTPEAVAKATVAPSLEQPLVRAGGILLPWKTWELEPGIEYIHSSRDHISIDGFVIEDILVIGDIESKRVRRDYLLGSLSLRVGLPWDTQLDLRLPGGYQNLDVVAADGSQESSSGAGFGDLELGLSKQLLRSRKWVPDLLGSLRWKTTTGSDPFETGSDDLVFGTGFHGLTASFTAVQVRDPVVFFSSLSYYANFEDEKSVGEVDPGDGFGLQLGMAMALNLETSISFGWEQRFISETEVDGESIAGSELRPGTIRIGASYVPLSGRSVDFGVNIGTTDDVPDVAVSLHFPLRFQGLPFRK